MQERALPVPICVSLKKTRGLKYGAIIQGAAYELHSEGKLILAETARDSDRRQTAQT